MSSDNGWDPDRSESNLGRLMKSTSGQNVVLIPKFNSSVTAYSQGPDIVVSLQCRCPSPREYDSTLAVHDDPTPRWALHSYPKSVFYDPCVIYGWSEGHSERWEDGSLPVALAHNSPVKTGNKLRMIKHPGSQNLSVGQVAPT